MRYHYDNSAANPRNPNQPPHRVRHGNQATDEMAHLSLRVLPRDAQDRRPALQEAIMLHHIHHAVGCSRNQEDLLLLTESRIGWREPHQSAVSVT